MNKRKNQNNDQIFTPAYLEQKEQSADEGDYFIISIIVVVGVVSSFCLAQFSIFSPRADDARSICKPLNESAQISPRILIYFPSVTGWTRNAAPSVWVGMRKEAARKISLPTRKSLRSAFYSNWSSKHQLFSADCCTFIVIEGSSCRSIVTSIFTKITILLDDISKLKQLPGSTWQVICKIHFKH